MKKKTYGQLKKLLDKTFSEYVRKKFSNKDGTVNCYTCGKKYESYKKVQCGHFVSRQYLATRWSEDNCRPQDWGCNGFGRGQTLDFEEHLQRDLGKKKVAELKKSRHKVIKLYPIDLEKMIEKFKNKLKTLEK